MNKKELYENIMRNVSRNVKAALNEDNKHLNESSAIQMERDSYLHSGVDAEPRVIRCDSISEMIDALKKIQKVFGDVPVMSARGVDEFTEIKVSEDEANAPYVALIN